MTPVKRIAQPWLRADGTRMSPAEVRNTIESKVQAAPALNPSFASNTVAGPDSIAELARALKNNVDLIYQYVYNNIEFYPFYGIQKGALGALIDGMGGPFDQCMLLVALLRQAGYTASYVTGSIQLTATQLHTWLGTDPSSLTAAQNVLTESNVPFSVVGSTLELNHIWVQVNISGTNYVFDPSFKTYSYEAAQVNLTTATGYSQSTFLSQAESGATITSDSVLNMNRANVRSEMATYAQNLQNYISQNLPAASLDDVLGGKTIVQNLSPVRQASLPYETPGDTPTIYTGDLPNGYRIKIEIQFPGIDEVFYSDQIHHQHLTLTFNSSNEGVLTFTPNGGTQQQWTGTAVSGLNALTITATFMINSIVESAQSGIPTGGTYWVGTSFGPCAREAINYHKNLLAQNIAAGNADTSEPVLGEALGVQWFTYCALTSRYHDMLGRILNCSPIVYLNTGVAGYDGSAPYFDVSIVSYAYPDLTSTGTTNNLQAYNASPFLLGGAEGLVLRQQYASEDVDTNRIMDEATINGITIYDGNSSNWSTVQSNLTNYDPAFLSALQSTYINQGGRLIIPANGDVPVGSITDYGLFACLPGSNFGTFIGRALGAYIIIILGPIPIVDGDGNTAPEPGTTGSPEPGNQTDEPIQLWQGNYLFDRTDITVGSGAFPYKLEFARHYDSQERYSNGPVGLGWTHNFNISAIANSDVFQTSGDAGGSFAAATIATAFVISDLSSDASGMPLSNIVVSALAERWMAELVTNNTVLVSFPGSTEIFVMQPNGSYAPISYNGSTLTVNAGAFTYVTKTGQIAVFNTSGQIASWSWPSGVSLSFNYTSGLLSSVTNGLSRTLSFGYTGNLLTSVSDGNGRSVGYSYDGNDNLVAFSDTLSHSTTYSYPQSGLLGQIFLPQNPTNAVVTNTFDTLGRVETQSDANNNQWTYYFAGSRSEEDDPLGDSRVSYFNRFGKRLRFIDQLGNETDSSYDGLNRPIQMTMPEGNAVQLTYDSKSNVLSRTMIAKPGSGLGNIVNSFTYDPTWNKVHTATDGNNNTTTYNYDSATGSLLTIQKPQVNSQTPQIKFTYNSRGQVLTRTDETSIVTQNNYDVSTEKLLSAVLDYGSSPHLNLTNSLGYDAVGDITSFTDANGNATSYQFDSERRLTQKTDPSPLSYVTQHAYDFNGQRTSTQRATGATPAWQTYTFAYYLTGKLESITDPLSYVTSYGFDTLNRLSTVTDPATRVTTYGYDARSMVKTVTDNSGAVADTRAYTNNGRLQSNKDANNNLTQSVYDGFDRVSTRTYADTSYEQYSYDANSNVLTFRTRKGNNIVRTFDALNRVSTKAPAGEPTVTFSFDLASRLTQASTPTQAGNFASGAFQFSYDSAGRFYQEVEPDSKSMVMQLDPNGNITQLTYPTGYFIARVYDQVNRLTDVKLNGSTSSALHFGYDSLSRRTQLTYGNGAVVNYQYQLNDDMTSLQQVYNGTANVTFSYGFNQAHQLISQTVTDSSYIWEPSVASTTTYGAANSLNEYPSVGGTTYQYDQNGCVSGIGSTSYNHDTENRFALPSPYVYNYDGLQRLIQSTNGGSANNRFFYLSGRMIQLSTGTDTLNVFGTRVDEPLIQVSGGTATYLHHDRTGSIIATTNTSATVSNKVGYSPFGETALATSGFGFIGEWLDAFSGLYYFRKRMYSPPIGRFFEPDPIRFAGGPNFYSYTQNDPLNLADPSGLAVVLGPLPAFLQPLADWLNNLLGQPNGDSNPTPTVCFPPRPGDIQISEPGPSVDKPGGGLPPGVSTSDSGAGGDTSAGNPPQPGDPEFIGPVKPPGWDPGPTVNIDGIDYQETPDHNVDRLKQRGIDPSDVKETVTKEIVVDPNPRGGNGWKVTDPVTGLTIIISKDGVVRTGWR